MFFIFYKKDLIDIWNIKIMDEYEDEKKIVYSLGLGMGIWMNFYCGMGMYNETCTHSILLSPLDANTIHQ